MYQRIQFDIHLRQHKKHTVCLCVVLKPQEVEKLIERITAYRVSSSLRDTASKLQGILQFLIFKCLKVQEAEAGSAKNKQTKKIKSISKTNISTLDRERATFFPQSQARRVKS